MHFPAQRLLWLCAPWSWMGSTLSSLLSGLQHSSSLGYSRLGHLGQGCLKGYWGLNRRQFMWRARTVPNSNSSRGRQGAFVSTACSFRASASESATVTWTFWAHCPWLGKPDSHLKTRSHHVFPQASLTKSKVPSSSWFPTEPLVWWSTPCPRISVILFTD